MKWLFALMAPFYGWVLFRMWMLVDREEELDEDVEQDEDYEEDYEECSCPDCRRDEELGEE